MKSPGVAPAVKKSITVTAVILLVFGLIFQFAPATVFSEEDPTQTDNTTDEILPQTDSFAMQAADEGEPTDLLTLELPVKGNPKLDSALNQKVSGPNAPDSTLPMTEEDIPKTDNATDEMLPQVESFSMQTVEETVRVIIEANPGQAENVADVLSGDFNIEASYGDLIQTVVPVSRLTALAERDDIRFVRTPMTPLPFVTSDGVPVINADDWQIAGYNGAGVKIGILDSGFSGYTDRQAEGELPAVTT